MRRCRKLILIMGLCLTNTNSDILDEIKRERADGFSTNNYLSTPYTKLPDNRLSKHTGNKFENLETNKMIGMDVQIDDSTYILGTGDGISIYMGGSINEEINSTIDYEGYLILPKIGAVQLKGNSLLEGKRIIGIKIAQHYKVTDYTIFLNKIREFKIYVLGEVANAGSYIITSGTRVSDAIDLAGGKTEQASLRNISIVNSMFDSVNTADLHRFLKCNQIEKNPVLREGDRIYIPKPVEFVSIEGAVNYPGKIDYNTEDSLAVLLSMMGGLSRGADSSKIIVNRFLDNGDSLITYRCSFFDSSVHRFKINKDDRIFVFSLPEYRVHRNVTIKGEVNYPGVFPIEKNKTQLRDILKLAGGLSSNADPYSSRLIRNIDKSLDLKEFERLRKLPPEHLSPLEKSFLAAFVLQESGKVSINFELLDSSNFGGIILQHEDVIEIALKTQTVKVIGAVKNPGLVTVKSGVDFNYYIDQTGGFLPKARKYSIRVMKNGQKSWGRKNDVKIIDAGDVIWVPEQYYRDPYTKGKEIIVMLGSIAAVIISALTIRDLTNN